MSWSEALSGRVGEDASGDGRIDTFDAVEARLVEAWGFLRRMPDPEAAWLRSPGASTIYARGQLSRQELWAAYQIDSADYDRDQLPKLPGLRSAEVDRMEETLGWLEWVEPRDRRLVGVVLAQLDRGETRPSWQAARTKLGGGIEPDTLRKRYGRALNAIAVRLSNGKK